MNTGNRLSIRSQVTSILMLSIKSLSCEEIYAIVVKENPLFKQLKFETVRNNIYVSLLSLYRQDIVKRKKLEDNIFSYEWNLQDIPITLVDTLIRDKTINPHSIAKVFNTIANKGYVIVETSVYNQYERAYNFLNKEND